MAPPTIRRPGHSKKAQFSAFTGYLIAATGALVGGLLLVVALWKPDLMAVLRGEATDIAAPVGEVGAVTRSGSISLFDTVSGYFNAGAQNARLKREAEVARVRLVEAQAVETENKRLKELLGLNEDELKPVTFGRLIGSTSASTRRFAYLSAGHDKGVRPGMPVRSPTGLIGRVLETGNSSARVLLLTDGASMVPVRRAQDDVVAFAEGRGDGSLRVRLINLGINPLKKGDVFVTSGAGGIYRPGIAVAVAMEITRDGAIAHPLGNPAATLYVAVDPVWQQEARRELETPANARNTPPAPPPEGSGE